MLGNLGHREPPLARGNGAKGTMTAMDGERDTSVDGTTFEDLGLRRATAVQQALVQRLGPEVAAKVRVEASSDPTAPVATERK